MRKLRKPLIGALALLLALLCAEWILQRYWPVLSTNYRMDLELLHTTVPGSRRIQAMPERAGGGRHLIRINSAGFRGPELDSPRTRPRILVIGDSLVLAGNVAEADTFPARLAAHLDDAYEVVNSGCESYGPDQSLLKLERDLPALQPDLIVLVLCATNDLGDLLRNKLFRLDDKGFLLQTRAPHAFDERVTATFIRNHELARRPALVRAWIHARNSRAARAAEREARGTEPGDSMPEYLYALEDLYQNTVVERDPVIYDLQQDIYDADVAMRPSAISSIYKQRLLSAILVRMSKFSDDAAVPLVALIVPSAVDLDPNFRIRVDSARYPDYDPRALDAAMSASLTAAEIAHLDLQELFEANRPEDLFVGWDDIHWNEAGIELAAAGFAAWLREGDTLPR